MINRLKGINQNAAYNALYYIVTSLIFILTTPVLMQYLGPAKYGIWILIQTTISILAVCQFGLGDTTVKFVSKYSAAGNISELNKVICSLFFMFIGLAFITSILLYTAAPYLVQSLFKLQAETVLIFRLSAIYLFFLFIHELLYFILKGLENYALAAKLSMSFFLLKNLLFLLLVMNGYGLQELVITMLLTTLAGFVITVPFTIRSLPSFRLYTLNARIVRELMGYSFYTWLQGVGTVLYAQSDKFLIGVFAGPQGVAYYSVITQLASQLTGFLTSVYSYAFPKVSSLYELGMKQEIAVYYKQVWKSKLVMLLLLGCSLLMCSHLIMSWWMGTSFADEVDLQLKGLIIACSFQCLSIIPGNFMNGLGNVKINFGFMLVIYSTAFIGFLLFIPLLGLTGAVLSKLLLLLPVVVYLVYSSKYMKSLH